VDRDGRATRVAYDALNRPVDESWYADANATSPLHTYSYVYDKGSRLLGAGDSTVYATYDYDALDRMRNED
jgi:YD repeat-containing protein